MIKEKNAINNKSRIMSGYFWGWMKEDPEKATVAVDAIIRNTYRTLMTRGQKGCYVYCTEPQLADYLKSRLNKVET